MWAALLGACAPRVGGSGDGGGDGGSSSDSSTTTTIAAGSSSGAASSDSTETTGATLGCEAQTPGCPEGCRNVSAHHATWDDPQLGLADDLCVAEGPPITRDRTAWWRMVDGELRFITANQECGLLHPPQEIPVEWTECSGAPDEPAACERLCAHDLCPGSIDVALLRECDVDLPCEDAITSGCQQTNVDCLLSSLRDRTPGRYELVLAPPNQEIDWVLLVGPDGRVQSTYSEVLNQVCAPEIWQPARACDLADPQVFAACLADHADCLADCFADPYTLDGMLVDCVDSPASCI